MKVSDFPLDYRLKMIRAYPVIAQMDVDEEYFATAAERDEAFGRILANHNLQPTHQMFLAGQGDWRCICAGQGGEVYSAECPIHDTTVDKSDPHWRKRYGEYIEAQRRIKERLGW